jgi:hypothetical protein
MRQHVGLRRNPEIDFTALPRRGRKLANNFSARHILASMAARETCSFTARLGAHDCTIMRTLDGGNQYRKFSSLTLFLSDDVNYCHYFRQKEFIILN